MLPKYVCQTNIFQLDANLHKKITILLYIN